MTMNTKIITALIALAVLAGIGFFALNNYIYEAKQPVAVSDYKDLQFTIAGTAVKLEDGKAESTSEAGATEKVVTTYFGNEVAQDLDGDGRDDFAYIVTQTTGGSGTFYYVVGAVSTPRGYVGTEAVLLGDRIAPQTTEKGPNRSVIVNYAVRKAGEPMTTRPSLGKSMRLLLDVGTMQFGEVEQNFTGEADPARMTLTMKSWTWTKYSRDGKDIVPPVGKFVLTFTDKGTFSASTDCNSMNGSYSADKAKGTISFGAIATTLMYCNGSQEGEFSKMLNNASGFAFTGRGELILSLKSSTSTATFR